MSACRVLVVDIHKEEEDITVIRKYYQREEELVGQANALLAMILGSLFVQSSVVYVQYKRKSWLVIGKETWITMSFLRPAVDAAYRVSTNHDDKEVSIDPLSGMVCNKCTELSWLREYSS